MSDRLAVFAGRFDPFHNAHRTLAELAGVTLPVDRVLVIPSGRPVHKPAVASWSERLAMCRLGCAGLKNVTVMDLEADDRPAYTWETLARLPNYREVPVYVVGSDTFATIDTWYQWRSLLTAVNWAVVPRVFANDQQLQLPTQPAWIDMCYQVATAAELALGRGRLWYWDYQAPAISATSLRAMVAAGDVRWQEFVPPAVCDYVISQRCYADDSTCL